MVIDPYFDTFIDDLVSYAKKQGDALILKEHQNTTWCNFTNEAEEFDPTDIPELGMAFSRSEVDGLNDQYKTAIKDGGTFADIMAINLQADYMAAMERAYRLRHAGKVRRQAWSAARLIGHGKSKTYDEETGEELSASGIFDRVRNQVNQIIESGETDNYFVDFDEEQLAATEEVVIKQLELMGRSEADEDLHLLEE